MAGELESNYRTRLFAHHLCNRRGTQLKIDNLKISNFRGIRKVEATALGSLIVIAGQNGSGKSCIFDAIRLLKSVYGGYQQNEWQQWMGEFQIRLSNRSSDFVSMLNDPSRELRISCDFRLSQDEREYLSANANELVKESIWRVLLPEAYEWGGYRMASFATQFREREPEVAEKANQRMPLLTKELAQDTIRGECFIPVGSTPYIQDSIVLSIIFSTFRPQHLGVIDYHGAQRHYGRELLQGINLNLDAIEQQQRTSALYNSAAKYNNVKSEMAASYFKEILAEKAGVPQSRQSTLTNTLKELFASFFPDKTFLGPTPTIEGSLSFPVRVGGSTHDLDELSAGEKEILYGYLRIRNSAPKHSIILLDEPELHLNPRLIRGLPQFYHNHLGIALDNQIWLVSHSDALLREVVGRKDYNVFHMTPCGQTGGEENQLKALEATDDLDVALVDLVGDLAAYRPNAKVIIFEGGGDSDFDQKVTSALFPSLQGNVNLISGSNKIRVRALHETLHRAYQAGTLPFKFFAICDRDTENDTNEPKPIVNSYSWDVYHIENYLLSPSHIRAVLLSLGKSNAPAEREIIERLRDCARETLPQLIRHQLGEFANDILVKCINTGTNPNAVDGISELSSAINRSLSRLSEAKDTLDMVGLRKQSDILQEKYEAALANESWAAVFPGRNILKRFVNREAPHVSYEIFRNLIVSRMADTGHQPQGMKNVIDVILAS